MKRAAGVGDLPLCSLLDSSGDDAATIVSQPTPYVTAPVIVFDHLFSAACGDPSSQPFGTILRRPGPDPRGGMSVDANSPSRESRPHAGPVFLSSSVLSPEPSGLNSKAFLGTLLPRSSLIKRRGGYTHLHHMVPSHGRSSSFSFTPHTLSIQLGFQVL